MFFTTARTGRPDARREASRTLCRKASPRISIHGSKLSGAADGRARQVTHADFAAFDLILAMDGSNLSTLRERCPAEHLDKLHLTLEPVGGGDVPDPYYGGPEGFETNYAMLTEAIAAWLDRIAA